MAESEKPQPPAPGGGEDLSQAEIDRMMAATATAAVPVGPPVFRSNGERYPDAETPPVDAYDFTNPMIIDELALRTLRQRHTEFAALVSARLSIFLRMDFALKLQRISSQVFNRFTASVPNPSHVVLFKLEPLAGVGVLDVNMQLGLSIVDRMLGGKGNSGAGIDGLTEIEMNLLDDIVLVVLEEWSRLWGTDRRLSTAIIGRENGGRYLQTSASDTVMLVAVFEGVIGEVTERLQIAIPFPSIEPIVRGFSVARLPAPAEPKRAERRSAWRPAYNAIPIRLSVEWDACELPLREVLRLAPGSVLRLPREIIRDTRLRLADFTKFVGEIGVDDGRLVVRIDQRISAEEV